MFKFLRMRKKKEQDKPQPVEKDPVKGSGEKSRRVLQDALKRLQNHKPGEPLPIPPKLDKKTRAVVGDKIANSFDKLVDALKDAAGHMTALEKERWQKKDEPQEPDEVKAVESVLDDEAKMVSEKYVVSEKFLADVMLVGFFMDDGAEVDDDGKIDVERHMAKVSRGKCMMERLKTHVMQVVGQLPRDVSANTHDMFERVIGRPLIRDEQGRVDDDDFEQARAKVVEYAKERETGFVDRMDKRGKRIVNSKRPGDIDWFYG